MLNERLGDHSIQYFEDKNYKVVKHGWNEKKDEPREEVIGYYNCIYDAVKVIARIRADKKSTLAVVWQLVKMYYLKLIGDKKEDDLVQWVNDTTAGKVPAIANFKDKSLDNGKAMIQVCAAIEPRAVNWDLVTAGETDEDKKNNAKYAISVARKLGAVVFCIWEDIVNVSQKQFLIYFATMMEIQIEMAAKK